MVTIKKNHFYRESRVDNAVGVKAQYKDLPLKEDTLLTLKGGVDPTLYIVSGTVPSAPKYGQYEIDGGELRLYVSGVTMDTQPTIPSLSLYKMEDGIQISQGGLSLAHLSGNTDNAVVGDKLNVYVSTMDADNIFFEETFDGTDKSLGEVKLFENQTNSTVTLSDAYVSASDGASKLYAGGGGYPFGGNETQNLKDYFSSSDKVPVAPVKSDKKTGLWSATVDNRPNKWQVYQPYWKWKDIAKILQFGTTAPSTNNPDTEPEPATNTTALSDFYVTPNINNPFSQDANNSLIMSSVTLSTEKSKNGPQSLRFYHLFDFSPFGTQMNIRFGDVGFAPQVARASLNNIPFPIKNTFGGNDANYYYGDNRTVVAQMNVSMNIAKLAQNVVIDITDSDLGDSFSPYAQAYSVGSTLESNFNAAIGARSVAITFSNYEPQVEHTTLDKFLKYGMDNFYTGEKTDCIVGGIVFLLPIAGTEAYSFPDVTSDFCYAFPIPVTKYAAPTAQVNPFVNSGSMFFVTGTNTSANPGASTGAEIMFMDYMARYVSGSGPAPAQGRGPGPSAGSGSWSQAVGIPLGTFFDMDFCFDPYQYVSVNTNSQAPYQTDVKDSAGSTKAKSTLDADEDWLGSPIRCYFTSLPKDEDNPLLDIPYIDIPFPASGVNAASTALAQKYTFDGDGGISGVASGSLWPKCMTIWVNNYRYTSSNKEAFENPWEPYLSNDKSYYAAVDYGTAQSGMATEAEVYVDSIILKNFNYDIANASKSKGPISREITIDTVNQTNQPLRRIYNSSVFPYVISSQTAWQSGSDGEQPLADITGSWETNTIPNVLSLGFNEKAYLPLLHNGTNEDEGRGAYLLFSGYRTTNYANTERLLPTTYASGGFSAGGNSGSGIISISGVANTNVEKLGGQVWADAYAQGAGPSATGNYGDNAIVSGQFAVSLATGGAIGGTLGGDSGLYLATGSNDFLSVDGLTQKGFAKLIVSGAHYDNWFKRENILVSAKLTALPDFEQGSVLGSVTDTISVDNPDIFSTEASEEYIIFKAGWPLSDASARLGMSRTLTLGQDDPIQGDNISLIVSGGSEIKQADDGSDLLTKTNLPYLYISPKKYWITILNDRQGRGKRAYDSIGIINQNLSGAVDNLSSYTGSTYNEPQYSYVTGTSGINMQNKGTSGIYLRPWNTDPAEENTSLITQTDFGFGVYDVSSNRGGQLAEGMATDRQYMSLDISPLLTVQDKSSEITYDSPFLLRVGLANDIDERSVTIIGDEYSDADYTPLFTWSYLDELPQAQNLTVTPATQLIGEDIDLYKLTNENLHAVKFEWEEDADDVWYRHLFINNNNISNKYTNARCHMPLNESTTGSYTFSNYTTGTGTQTGTITQSGTGVIQTIEGLQGYTLSCSADSYLYIGSGSNGFLNDLKRYLYTMHIVTPSGGPTASGMFLASIGAGSGSGWDLQINDDGYVIVQQAGSSVTGTTILPFDGQTPTNITVKYTSGSTSGRDLELYIDGTHEGFQSNVDGVAHANFNIGRNSTAATGNAFTGYIEECIIYDLDNDYSVNGFQDDILVIDNSKEYVYSTTDLLDLYQSKAVTHQAKMFIYDYHNIRGTTDAEICSTNQTSWRTTPI